jgi:hypothetical protein
MSKRHILPTTIAIALSTAMIAVGMGPVFAGDQDSNAAKQTGENAPGDTPMNQWDLVKISEDTMLSMRDINDARLALFNGQLESARTEVDAALTRINTAVNEAEEYALDVKAPKQDDWYVPFDTSVTMVDTYERNDGKADAAKDQAAKQTQSGAKSDATDLFKLSEVDFAVSAGLVPVKFAQQQIVDAARLIDKGEYFEANMALKAVDDAIVVQTVAVDDEPANDDAS